jgi:hypothetical protein
MHADSRGSGIIVIAAGYRRMNESFIYAICSEGHIPAALCILRRMAIDLRMTKNYKLDKPGMRVGARFSIG